jgi:hypothetical protein
MHSNIPSDVPFSAYFIIFKSFDGENNPIDDGQESIMQVYITENPTKYSIFSVFICILQCLGVYHVAGSLPGRVQRAGSLLPCSPLHRQSWLLHLCHARSEPEIHIRRHVVLGIFSLRVREQISFFSLIPSPIPLSPSPVSV